MGHTKHGDRCTVLRWSFSYSARRNSTANVEVVELGRRGSVVEGAFSGDWTGVDKGL